MAWKINMTFLSSFEMKQGIFVATFDVKGVEVGVSDSNVILMLSMGASVWISPLKNTKNKQTFVYLHASFCDVSNSVIKFYLQIASGKKNLTTTVFLFTF